MESDKKMSELIPCYKENGGWPDNEPILFELDYWWNSKRDNSDTRIFFKVVISPGDNQELINTLAEDYAHSKQWCNYEHNDAKIKPLTNIPNKVSEIFNNLGGKISDFNFSNNFIDVSNLETGMYFLKITSEKTKSVSKFMINK